MTDVATAHRTSDDGGQPSSLAGQNRRLLVVTTIPGTFNAFLVPYSRYFRRLGWTVHLASGAGPLTDEGTNAIDQRFEIPWCRSLWSRRHVTDAVGAFRRVARDGRYDIVHLHTPIAAALARASLATLSRRQRPAVVYTAHGFHFGTNRGWHRDVPFQAAEWVAGRYTDQLIVLNETDFRNAVRLRITSPDRIVHLPGIGVDFSWYQRTPTLLSEASNLRADLRLGPDDVLFSVIAGLHPGKGHDEALHALAALPRTDAHLAFAGTGVLRSKLEATIEDLNLRRRVHLLDQVADIRPLALASSAMVLPSFREGLSRAVLEALALGVPVIGSDIRGIRDTVLPDGGILVPPGDVDALAKAMTTATDTPLLDESRRLSIRRRLAPYSIDALLTAHADLYRKILAAAAS